MSFLNSLDEETKQSVFSLMRQIRNEATFESENHRSKLPKIGEKLVGSRDMDDFFKSEIKFEFLRLLNQGKDLEETKEAAISFGKEMIQKWNTVGCKSRVSISSKVELERSEIHNDDLVWTLYRKFKQLTRKKWKNNQIT